MIKRKELLFARCVIRKGMVSWNQMSECIEALRKNQKESTLKDILVKKGYAKETHLRQILAELEKSKNKSEIIPGKTVLGKYLLFEKMGEGAMGAVYKAENIQNKKIIAVKILDHELARDEEFIARFLREAKTAAKLKRHKNIVEAYDFGEEKGVFYFAMEFVDGYSLAEILYSKGKIGERQALTITKQVTGALLHASQFSIVHRDIKPENIMISSQGVVKLCDLGLAKDLSEDISFTGGITLGTVYYASPEQASGSKNLDIRSDIYSLGISLYHMVTGELPFDDSDTMKVIKRQIREELPSVRAKTPNISDATVKLIHKMTAKSQQQRYQSPTDLLKDIVYMLRGNEEKLSFFNGAKNSSGGRKMDKLVLKKKKLPLNYVLWRATIIAAFIVAILIMLMH